jgi:hypothetical protein
MAQRIQTASHPASEALFALGAGDRPCQQPAPHTVTAIGATEESEAGAGAVRVSLKSCPLWLRRGSVPHLHCACPPLYVSRHAVINVSVQGTVSRESRFEHHKQCRRPNVLASVTYAALTSMAAVPAGTCHRSLLLQLHTHVQELQPRARASWLSIAK